LVNRTEGRPPKSAPDVVVRPPDLDEYGHPYRIVEVRGTPFGRAGGLADVLDLLGRTGVTGVDPLDLEAVEWKGVGPGVWA
jgi:hypothetical protein